MYFEHPEGNREFVCSKTIDTGKTRRMIYNAKHPALALQKLYSPASSQNLMTLTGGCGAECFHDAPDRPRIYANGEHAGRRHSLRMRKPTMDPFLPSFQN